MKSLISYGLAGFIFFTADTAVDPGIGPQEQLSQEQLSDDQAAPPMRPATPSPDVTVPPLSADKAISDALALHGNPQKSPLSVFMDLIRIMERNGYERNAAIYVAIEMAKNPNLDNMAGLTVTGSLREYQETTNEKLDEAVTKLVKYIERPALWSSRVNERFGLLSPDVKRLIGEKAGNGNQIAAERLMEEALLRRFSPSLAAKLFVPRNEFPLIQDVVLSGEAPLTKQRRQTQQVGVLSKASKSSALGRIMTAHAGPARGNSSVKCFLRCVATRR
jgi:hypothetical protein